MKGSTFAKGCGFGCAGLVLLGILLMVAAHFFTTPEMREEWKKKADADYKAQRSAEKAKVDPLFKALSDLRVQLSAPGATKDQSAAGFNADEVRYLAVDYGLLTEFTDQGFVADPKAPKDPPFYRDQTFRNVEGNAIPSAGRTEPDYRTIGLILDELNVVPYVAVIRPVKERYPVLVADGKSFQPGYFDGWVYFVDWKTKTVLGQARITAQSSAEIRSFQVGIHSQMLLGDDLKKAMEHDFEGHLWEAANAAIAKICGHDGQAGYAEHQAYWAHGS